MIFDGPVDLDLNPGTFLGGSSDWIMVWSLGHSKRFVQAFNDTNILHNGNALYTQHQPGIAFKVCVVQHNPKCNESQMATLKWCPTLYINLSSRPAGEVIFGLLQPYCASWFMHLICFVWADSAAVNEWLNGEEAGWRVTSRVAATLINSLGFI